MKILKSILYLAFILFVANCSNHISDESENEKSDRIPVIPMEWKEKDHILEGWDWSLPPYAKAHPYSGTTMPWKSEDGRRYDLPGNEFTKVRAQWRELEPEEGSYN
ncbi:MAG: hypothetical protein KAS71_03620, partial [Bacteroidales bacterium]|nr:hypothetical protein [Bacteroidales bacterium]